MLLYFSLLFFQITFAQSLSKPPVVADVFRARLSEDLGTMDWNYGELNPEIVYQIMEGLFTSDSKGNPEKAIAERFQFSSNHKSLKIRLGKNHFWTDGKPVCAAEFVTSWQRLKSKEFGSPYAHYAAPIGEVKAKGCYDLEIGFNRECPEALSLFSHYVFFPLRNDQLKNFPKAFTDGKGLITNGPYKISQWQSNQKISLRRNERYPWEKKRATALDFIFVPEDATAKIQFDRGDIHWMKSPPPLLMKDKTFLKLFPSFTVYYFGLNSQAAPVLNSVDVRKALRAALSLEELPSILGAETKPVFQWVPSSLLGEKIKSELLPSANIEQYRGAMQTQLKLRVYSKAQPKLLAEWAQGQWEKKLKVRIPLEIQESKVYWKEISTKPAPLFLSGVTAPFFHPRAFLQEFLPKGSANWTSWNSSTYEDKVAKGDFIGAEYLISQDSWVLPLYEKEFGVLMQGPWKDFWINPLGQMYFSKMHAL